VWQGQTEPSLAIDARDGEAGVTAWAAELGKKFDQDSVLLFHPDPAGDSASYSFALKGRTEEDAINEMQKAGIPGGRIVDGKLELIGKGRDFQKKVDHLADEMALSYNARVGHLTLLERGSYDEAIRKAHAEADAARAEQVAGIKAAAAGRAAAEAGRGVAGGRDQGVGAGNAVAGRVKQGALPRPEGNRAGP
jgi:hypothetical protein